MQITDVASWISDPDNFGVLVSIASTLVALILGLIIGGIVVSNHAGKQQRTMDEHAKSVVIADVLDCTNEVSVWGQLSPAGQAASDRAVARADIRLRVLPVQGAGALADWAGHQLNEIKRNSTTGAPLQTVVDQFRDRLVLWLYNPKRAAKQCARDLERWAFVGGTAPAPTGRRKPAAQAPGYQDTGAFAPVADTPPAMPPALAPQAQIAPVQIAPAPAPGPAPVPASTSSIPAAAAAHAQAAAAVPKDPFEDLLGPGAGR